MFPSTGLQPIALADAELLLDPAWLSRVQADALFQSLRSEIDWEVHRIRMYGRDLDAPRLSSWIGDPEAVYTYSRTCFLPRPWPSVLLDLRGRLEETVGAGFNSVLANLYRDGHDRMGWHSDDEPELGPLPVIASVSLGAVRRFAFKPRGQGDRRAFDLPHGSLLVMRGETQRRYLHALPATAKPVGERINLTFRRIFEPDDGRDRSQARLWTSAENRRQGRTSD